MRTDLLTASEMYNLDVACGLIRRAFGGEPPYLVGTAGLGGAAAYRDVDVRLMLAPEEFAATCPTRERWELLCAAISAWLKDRTGLPVDFQIQDAEIANARHSRDDGKMRNPLGMGRTFAGGGDGTPDWPLARKDAGINDICVASET